ncbi:hypothetical protein RI129_007042 [Pyrocoelia pectoralis]|uniref:Uncharacterized protein n=1 Tax=Pyrocoelia pectoralis TaxID=417401 RepID=A0AAN7V910_9COLE
MKMLRIKIEWSFLSALLFCLLPDRSLAGIHLSHSKATIELGHNFMVTCRDEAGRPVSWSGPKGTLGTKSHPGVEVSSYGTSLAFVPVTKDDGGTYSCRVGHDVSQFHLTVEVPITFMDTPPEQIGEENMDVTLRCEVKGGDKTVLIWTSEGKELQPPKYQQMGDGLLIRNVTRADSKTYTCRAMQRTTGNIRDQNIILKVEHKPVPRYPHLWKQIEQAWAFIGGDVNLTCEVDANPPAKFEWFRKNRLITVRDKAAIHEPHRSILQLHANNSIVFGDYKCRATNRLGKLEKFITLQQGVQPDPPDLVRLHETRRYTISLNIEGPDMTNKTVATSMLPSGYRIQYKTTEENLDWDHAATVDFMNREDNSYTLQELDKNTMYEIRVATRNLAGISEYTNSSIFKTSSAPTLAIISPFKLLVYLSCPIIFALIL